MTDKKISELTEITGANTAADDYFVIVDTSADETKKISRDELNNAIEQDALSNVTITGGTIDGTVIGGTTPAAGTFTSGTFTGTAYISGGSNQITLDTGDQTTYGRLDVGHFSNGTFIGTYAGTNAAANVMRFGTSGTERARLDGSGNLLVGKTSADVGTSGTCLRGSISSIFTVSGSVDTQVAIFNRTINDGTILDFRKDGTTVGSIGTVAGDMVMGTGAAGLRFFDSGPAIQPRNSDGSANNDAIDLGISTNRFKDLYLSSGVYLGGTGAANKLDDYEEGTFTATLTADTAPTTPVTKTATYTKVGNLVTVHVNFGVENTTGASGLIQVTGLPFTSGYLVDQTGCPWHYGLTSSIDLVASVNYFSTKVTFRSQGVTAQASITPSTVTYLRFSVTYLAL
jgi:hypothetical protein